MKSLLALPIFCLVISNIFCSNKSIETFKFLNVENEYQVNEIMAFQLKNNSDTTYQFYVGIENFYNASWHPGITDIDTTAPDRGAIVKLIFGRQTVNLAGGPINHFSIPHPSSHSLNKVETTSRRFVLNYKTKSEAYYRKLYSREFILQ
jgi:hypothetical protein